MRWPVPVTCSRATTASLQLRATLYYRVVDPYAYVLQKDRLDAALERIVSASAVDVVAKRDLDAILVARPELLSADQQVAIKRERLRGDLAQEISGICASSTRNMRDSASTSHAWTSKRRSRRPPSVRSTRC